MSFNTSVSEHYRHSHCFDEGNPLGEKKTKRVLLLTLAMMVVEIAGGYFFNSMALLADGWHMCSHVLALGMSVLAYLFARKYAQDGRFAFGTWKIEILGGYTSAIFLVFFAALMLVHSVERLISPTEIFYDQAIGIAIAGLLVNLACAWLLKDGHGHAHEAHDHAHHHHPHEDLNLRAAYLHVVADAATSVLAIVALFAGKFWGAVWFDPVMGIVGAGVVSVWAYGLIRDSGRVLLDAEMDAPIVQEIKKTISQSPVRAVLSDLHVWRVGKGRYACIVVLVTSAAASPDYFRKRLGVHEALAHITVEVNQVAGPDPL